MEPPNPEPGTDTDAHMTAKHENPWILPSYGDESPLRYPGGKGRLAPWIATLIRYNNLQGGTYVEPYAGGAGVAMYLLTHGIANRIILNELDPGIHAFWKTVITDHKPLCDMIREYPGTMETRAMSRTILHNPMEHSETEHAFAALFMNRTSYSGILHGGAIGGKNQTGRFLLDARYKPEKICQRIERIAQHRRKISVYRMDATTFLKAKGGRLPQRTLVYADPPYWKKGPGLYRKHYRTAAQHEEAAAAMQALQRPTLISYDDIPQIRDLYLNMDSTSLALHYTTANTVRPHSSEAVFYSGLELPAKPTIIRTELMQIWKDLHARDCATLRNEGEQ